MNEYKGYEIYLSDLNEKTQKDILQFLGLKKPEEANLDTFPLVTIPKMR